MAVISGVLLVAALLSRETAALIENQACKVPATGENGQCIQFQNCQYARDLVRLKKNPEICGFKRNTPLVCCPVKQKLTESKPGALSQKKCGEYFNQRVLPQSIDFGTKSKSREFPHMAAVGYGQTKNLWLCGGTLISHRFVLSAAHCAYSADFGPATLIRVGDLDLKNTTEDADPQDFKITKIHVHPKYKLSSHYHDIALFKTEKHVYFGFYVKPACLQVPKNLPINTLVATGWGKMGFLGEASSHLLKADLTIVNHGTCAKRYANVAQTRKLTKGILDEFQICAGDAQGKDTCPGDSGGPLHYALKRKNNLAFHFVVAGITSFGKGCGGENSVGVYTRVSAYVRWIENIVWKEDD